MYTAKVIRLNYPRPHENADRLQIFMIDGHQVITDLSPEEGDIGIFFPPDGCVSAEFAHHNDLVQRKDENGNRAGGFMDHKRRVKAINLRGEKSQGLYLPLRSLSYLGGILHLNVGDEITSLHGVQFCEKYYTQKTRDAISRQKSRTSRKETPTFKKHFDTPNARHGLNNIKSGDTLIITEKVHGTSGRYGRSLEEVENSWFKRLLGHGKTRKVWKYLSGSRNVIFRTESELDNGFYDDNSFRTVAILPFKDKLYKGETIYFEIVGWTNENSPIMPSVNPSKLSDKTYVEKYGKEMYYKYGCERGTIKTVVYRITMSNEDGISYDLNWEQVKRRCMELGVEHVKEVVPPFILEVSDDRDFQDQILSLLDELSVGDSLYDSSHMREGVVIRTDNGGLTPTVLKYKSHEFLVLEGHTKDREDYVDMEEVS